MFFSAFWSNFIQRSKACPNPQTIFKNSKKKCGSICLLSSGGISRLRLNKSLIFLLHKSLQIFCDFKLLLRYYGSWKRFSVYECNVLTSHNNNNFLSHLWSTTNVGLGPSFMPTTATNQGPTGRSDSINSRLVLWTAIL